MKNTVRWLVVVLCGVAVLPWRLAAVEDSYVCGMTEKGAHGLASVVTGWVEFPMQIKKGYDRGVPSVAAPAASRSLSTLAGIGRGVTHTLGRTVWGAWELVTFWAPDHTSNADLLLLQDSAYAWQKGTMQPFACPGWRDGFERLGLRLERGIDDFVGGFLEVPGQIKKADAAGNFWPGIPMGFYCMAARLVDGFGNIVLVGLPGPVDNLMVPFEEVKAWDAWDGKYYNNVAMPASK